MTATCKSKGSIYCVHVSTMTYITRNLSKTAILPEKNHEFHTALLLVNLHTRLTQNHRYSSRVFGVKSQLLKFPTVRKVAAKFQNASTSQTTDKRTSRIT